MINLIEDACDQNICKIIPAHDSYVGTQKSINDKSLFHPLEFKPKEEEKEKLKLDSQYSNIQSQS